MSSAEKRDVKTMFDSIGALCFVSLPLMGSLPALGAFAAEILTSKGFSRAGSIAEPSRSTEIGDKGFVAALRFRAQTA